MRTIEAVAAHLEASTPWLDPRPVRTAAAVALVLRERAGDLEALFIRRAEHEGDPWSGDIAFPGGRIDPEDSDARSAAERETVEELSLELAKPGSADYLGQISDVRGNAESIRVSAFVYAVTGDPVLQPNYEIREAFWSSLDHCTESSNQEDRVFSEFDSTMHYPTIRLLDDAKAPVLWGITYKFMDYFMSTIERPIPNMAWSEDETQPPRA